jgi:hypothetical protein
MRTPRGLNSKKSATAGPAFGYPFIFPLERYQSVVGTTKRAIIEKFIMILKKKISII